ncbi:MAG: DUF664 domain-containing protein [Candidatus Eisenbacteria bacterium]|uniref:DUF664 domain-containing protein n=1 Tax=Eiseniibacteriota bacterium TaxID=2212470 RepID=A0A538TPA0_UNCEI|nr:MAG: DUF664 domain-containing protein [Candidatus Eisenbacteria bacterium]
MPDLSRQFISDSRAFLTEDYMPKIERCLAQLTPEQVWSRSNDPSNSIGNLLLHLTGSSRYWAVEVIGGEPIGRVRQAEFDRRGPVSPEKLMSDLRAAMSEVDRHLAGLSGEALLELRATRDEKLTVLWCVYHLVEHFSMHTGQILSMTKAFVGELRPAPELK